MSLLEDVFLNDEAGEAQELERVIEGDEYDERPRSPLNSDDNSEKEDEAVEDKRRVDPDAKAKRVVKNPRFTLNPARLTGPRGIQVIPEHFKDFQFKGKGHEKDDLDMVLKKLEHWAYRLYPKFQFEDCLKKIETLGKKRPVMVHLHKIRSDQFLSEETVVQKDSSDDDETPAPVQEEDEFDKLLQQQIELTRATPTPGSVKKPGSGTPSVDKRQSLTMPKATSSPSISDEQKERMIRNRKLAEERRLARLQQNTTVNLVDKSNYIEEEPIVIDDACVRLNLAQNNDVVIDITGQGTKKVKDTVQVKKVNRSNVIDSDEESGITSNNLVIDMTEQDTNLSHKKADPRKNKMNVIDSDNDSNNLAIDMIEKDSNLSPKQSNTRKNKPNVIDSDDDSNADSNNYVIDMTQQDSIMFSKKADTRKNKSNVFDSDNDSNNLVIDMTEEDSNLSHKKTDTRKTKPNVIDSDDESNADTNNFVIDMTARDSNMFPKKADTRKNKSNGFNSDYELNSDSNMIIDMTEQDPNLSLKRADTRKNTSNVIDSDGESNNFVIDMTKLGLSLSHKRDDTRKNTSNVIDSDGESNNFVIDMTKLGLSLSHKRDDTRKNTSNVIDSDGESNNFVIDMTKLGLSLSHKRDDTRKNTSNIIDSNGESNNLVIDMTEQDSNLSHKRVDTRKNTSNFIDSDNESNNLVINITEQDSNLSHKRADIRKNTSNVIDSDNESNNLVIDMAEHGSNIFHTNVTKLRSNITDSSNGPDKTEGIEIDKSKNKIIDISQQETVKRNEPVDDSSDDEDMAVIQSISVDIHVNGDRNHTNFKSATMSVSKTNNINDDSIQIVSEMNVGIAKEINANDRSENAGNNNLETSDLIERNFTEIGEKKLENKVEEIPTVNQDIEEVISKKVDGNSKILDEKENIDSNVLQNEVEDLMDVDFSDDF